MNDFQSKIIIMYYKLNNEWRNSKKHVRLIKFDTINNITWINCQFTSVNLSQRISLILTKTNNILPCNQLKFNLFSTILIFILLRHQLRLLRFQLPIFIILILYAYLIITITKYFQDTSDLFMVSRCTGR